MLFDIALSNIILGMSPQARETKAKVNKWGHLKLKIFCTAEKTISQGQPTRLEKVFANDISDKRLMPQNIQNSYSTTKKKPNLKMDRQD